nr:hypothetical protein HK105_004836 [Polyrhizophydium stewartii]
MGEESLADPIVTAFDTTGEGQVKWFAAPPIDVVSSVPPPLHTLDYLYEKARRKAAATTTAGSAPPTQPPAPLARTAAPTATPAVTKSDAHADGSEMDVDEPAAVVGGNPLEAALAALADAWLSEASSLRSSRVR